MPDDLVAAPGAEPTTTEVTDSPTETTGAASRRAPAEASGDASAWHRWRERRRNRVTRWDRPPPRKDWRYFVGLLGKVLIVTGLLMFGFVAYQLWGTGIETARAQNQLENEFEEQFEAAVAARADQPGTSTTPATPTTRPGADSSDEVGDESTDGSSTDSSTDEPTAEPGVGGASGIVPGGIDVSDGAVVQDVPVVPGEAFAKLDIDKIGIDDLYVIPGVALDDLKKGPGHYPDTPLPGQLGNASLAGHRTTYGAPFFDLDQLEPGDEIVVTMVTGDQYVYRVTGSEVVTAADYWVITTRDPDVAELTLTTCDPKYTARNRLVVHSVLVPEASSQVGVAEFYDMDELESADAADEEAAEDSDDEPIPGDDPTVTVPPDTSPGVADPDTTEPVDESPAVTSNTDPTDEATAPPTEIDPENAELDAFSEGWFHDRAAWPQIALWAAVLTLICLGGYQIAKRTRHDSVGVLVGIVPFLIALYFFYQNVNRLLPPGL